MPDICIFYSKEDKLRVEKFGGHLKNFGWDIWWYDYNDLGNWPAQVESKTIKSKCVIPVWTGASIGPNKVVANETKFAKDNNIPIFPVRMDEVVLPMQFNLENTTDLLNWDGESHHQGLSELTEKLIKGAGLPNAKWNGKRPDKLCFNGIEVKIPGFVRSISSHETQLKPELALEAMLAIPTEDPLLISAYDFHVDEFSSKDEKDRHQRILKQLQELKNRGYFILMDSGKYEASRKDELELTLEDKQNGKVQKIKDEFLWTEEKYNKTLEYVPFDFAFCFDNINPPNDSDEIIKDVIERLNKDKNIIPIVHAPMVDEEIRDSSILPDVFYSLSKKIKPNIIAVPERELGDGIFEKARAVRSIRNKLDELDYYQPIHILGTGNPLSIVILAAAGGDLFDGLEWCRTVIDRNSWLLYHHQQFEFGLKEQAIDFSTHLSVRQIVNDKDPLNPEKDKESKYALKWALHNMDSYESMMEDLREALKTGNPNELVLLLLGWKSVPKSIVDEIKKKLPEFF